MFSVHLIKDVGERFVYDLGADIKSLEYSTEENKGFSSCRIGIGSNVNTRNIVKAIDGKTIIRITILSEIVWEGFIAGIEINAQDITLEGVGYYEILNDYYYDDQSEYINVLHSFTATAPAYSDFSSFTGTQYMIAYKCVNDSGIDCGSLSFSVPLKRTGSPALTITPFIDRNPAGTIPTHNTTNAANVIESSVVSESGGDVEFRIDDSGVILNGATFFVGLIINDTTVSGDRPTNKIEYYADSVGAGTGNVIFSNDGSDWSSYNTYNKKSSVIVDFLGKWNYSPGAYQHDIIYDIVLAHTNELPGSDVKRLFFSKPQNEDLTVQIPYFTTTSDRRSYETMTELMKYGSSANPNLPLKFYIYENRVIGLKELDYSQRPKATIILKDENRAEGVNFQDMYTIVKGSYTDEDNAKAETTNYYTGISNIRPRMSKISLGTLADAEADIVTQVENERQKAVTKSRELEVSEGELFIWPTFQKMQLWKIRAGDLIQISDSFRINNFYDDKSKTVLYVRSTTYDPIENKLSLDLSRESDLDVLAGLLGASDG